MCLLRVPFRNHGCLKTLSIRTERQVKCRCRRQHLIPCPVDRFLYDWVFTCQAPLFFTLYCLTREVKCAPPQGPSATMAQGPFFLSTPRASSIRIILRFHRTSPPPIPAHLAPFACSSRVRRPPNSPPLSHFISRFLVRLTTSTFGISSD